MEMSDETFNGVVSIIAGLGILILVFRFWLEKRR